MMETEGSDIFTVINGGQGQDRTSTVDNCEEDFLDEGKCFELLLSFGESRACILILFWPI